MPKKMKLNTTKSGLGMCPKMSEPKKITRRKPKPYKAPVTVKKYYKGINYGIDLLKEELINMIEDEETQALIKDKAAKLKISASLKLTNLEKQKTKQRIKDWEEKEWESI